ncbi:hypothetical protein V6N13_053130 [Hibiscus sabdariffa]|uniref:Homeobox domain-containing protein n=2 Tax=Hibiscus sabdariffa TaxID=183260 RepID=A0ABR2Q6C7_9ROSI
MSQEKKCTRTLDISELKTEMVIMEWDQQQDIQPQNQREENGNLNVNNGGVMVMTDEQLETLRKQIAVYASLCEQLVQMHNNLTAQSHQHLTLTGGRLGNLYSDPLMTHSGHKISARQRWTPTAVQLRILERIFDEVTGTPSKQKIKEITSELSQHGQISETNVYNWFQNRRARSKRKQAVAAESEVETEVESPKTKQDNLPVPQAKQDACFQNPQITSQLHLLGGSYRSTHGRVSEI